MLWSFTFMLSLSITLIHHRKSKTRRGENPLYSPSVHSLRYSDRSGSEHNIKSATVEFRMTCHYLFRGCNVSRWQCQPDCHHSHGLLCTSPKKGGPCYWEINDSEVVPFFFLDVMYLASSEAWQPVPVDHQIWKLFFSNDWKMMMRITFFDMHDR